MDKIELFKGDITQLKVDAIVNAANSSLLGGGGVDGAIHRAAGPALLNECRQLNNCETGKAKLTRGYNLPAQYVIHTVGPIWKNGKMNEPQLLESCYNESLHLAAINHFETIAFPNISTGVYRFPKKEAAKVAINTTLQFLKNNAYPQKVIFAVFDDENYEIYKNMLP